MKGLIVMEIIRHPDKRLRKVCLPVSEIDDKTIREASHILSTLKKMDSPLRLVNGLAANQIGYDSRIIVMKILSRYITIINPTKVSSRVPCISFDMCASLPWKVRIKKRYLMTQIEYTDLENNSKILRLYGSASFLLQQELDHLDGKLIID